MEQEYKWALDDPAQAETLLASRDVRPLITDHQPIEMAAIYYDTPDGLLWQLHGGLRLRQENDLSVCCMKLPVTEGSGCTIREEYEAEAPSVAEGLALLPGKGAPEELCTRLQSEGLVELCSIRYTRQAYQLHIDRDGSCCDGELTLDQGQASRQGAALPISEMEFELKDGDEALFHAFARQLEARYSLVPEHRSKLARAMDL